MNWNVRIIIFLLFHLLAFAGKCQEIKPTRDSCLVIVNLASNNEEPYSNRTIIFEDAKSNFRKVHITDSLGNAPFLLPKNTEFTIDVLNRTISVGHFGLLSPENDGLVKFLYDIRIDIFDESREGETMITNCFSNSEDLQPNDSTTLIDVSLVDNNNQPIAGRSVLFRDSLSMKVYLGQTNDSGRFMILLPSEKVYGVRLVDQGIRVPFNAISTVGGQELVSINLNLVYIYSEINKVFKHVVDKDVSRNKEGVINENLFVLSNVLFDFDKAVIKPAAYVVLNQILLKIKHRSYSIIEVSGHTDSFGNENYNLELSEDRANAVMTYLIEMGINPQKIRSIGKGELCPVVSNDTDKGREQNRRTEIRLLN